MKQLKYSAILGLALFMALGMGTMAWAVSGDRYAYDGFAIHEPSEVTSEEVTTASVEVRDSYAIDGFGIRGGDIEATFCLADPPVNLVTDLYSYDMFEVQKTEDVILCKADMGSSG